MVDYTWIDDSDKYIRIVSASPANKKEKNAMKKPVSRTIDLANLPKLSDEAKARFVTLNDSPIDYSEIPPLTFDERILGKCC